MGRVFAEVSVKVFNGRTSEGRQKWRPKRFSSFVAATVGRKGERGPAIVDAGLEAPSGEDAADRSGAVAGGPIAIEMRRSSTDVRGAGSS